MAKKRHTVYLEEETIERLKDVVYWTPGLNMSALAEEAMNDIIKKKAGGRPFQRRNGEIRKGRPVG